MNASEKLNVLFIGNSLTFFNKMPEMVQAMADVSGKDVFVDQSVFGGRALRHIVDNSELITKINENVWDVVILQSDDISAFPDMYSIEIATLTKFLELIRKNSPDAEILYQMIWGLKEGVNIIGEANYTYEQYFNKIYTGTLYYANTMEISVAPVGQSWFSSISKNPNIELFAADKAHPSLNGSYLAACTFYASIFKESVNSNSYHNELSPDMAIFFQEIASETVLDNLELWNLNKNVGIHKNIQNDLRIKTYPNPFSDKLSISFYLKNDSHVSLGIYDSQWKHVCTPINNTLNRGDHTFMLDDFLKQSLKSGVYYYHLKTDFYSYSSKIIYQAHPRF